MTFGRKPLGIALVAVVVVWSSSMLLFASSVKAQQPELWVRVSDTTTVSGAQNTVIAIYMNNYQDTVVGFNLYIMLDRIDIMEFQTDSGITIDTIWWRCNAWNGNTCTDSVMVPEDSAWDFRYIDTTDIMISNFDTTGTLVSGWKMVDARSLTGGFDVNIAGLANDTSSSNPNIPPQQGGLLIKILADVFNIPDTMQDRTVNLVIIYDFIDHFNFSRPDGSSIGIVYDIVEDTNCWVCTAWAGSLCTNWERVPVPPPGGCDSIEVVLDSMPRVDSTTVTLLNGSVTVLLNCCANRGNVDGVTGIGGPVDVADLTYLVGFLFQGGPAPPCENEGNVDGIVGIGGSIDVADLTFMVAFLFQGGPAPPPC